MKKLLLLFLIPIVLSSHSSDLNVLIGHKAENYSFDVLDEDHIIYACSKEKRIGHNNYKYNKNCILYSDDAGVSFDTLYSQEYLKELSYKNFENNLYFLKFINESTFISGGVKKYWDSKGENDKDNNNEERLFFLKTTNKGKSWDSTEIKLEIGEYGSTKIVFDRFEMNLLSNKYLIAADVQWTNIHFSDDLGETWQKFERPFKEDVSRILPFYDGKKIILFVESEESYYNNTVYISGDKGETWKEINLESVFYNYISKVKINDYNNIFIGALSPGNKNKTRIVKTDINFQNYDILFEIEKPIRGIVNFSIEDSYWAVASHKETFTSTNNGDSWESLVTYGIDSVGLMLDARVTADYAYFLQEFNWLVEYDETTGVKDNAKNEKLNIYPNPATEKIYIHFEEPVSSYGSKVTFFNSLGKKLFQRTGINNEINISHLENGVYYLIIENKDEKYIKKFIKR